MINASVSTVKHGLKLRIPDSYSSCEKIRQLVALQTSIQYYRLAICVCSVLKVGCIRREAFREVYDHVGEVFH